MKRSKKIIIVVLLIVAISACSFMIFERFFNLIPSNLDYKEDTYNFLTENLWDQENTGFFSSTLLNECCEDSEANKYTSFNIWACRSILKYSIIKDNFSIFENYGLKSLYFILDYLQNSTNKGFYHWVLANGSLPSKEEGDIFNNSIYQIGTYQAWVLLALTEIYEVTLNTTYIDVWGKQIADFLLNKLWDPVNGGFYSIYLPFYDEIIDTQKYTWYQTWPAIALMSLYEITKNETYMIYVNRTLDFIINNLWNNALNAVVVQCLENGTAISDTKITLTDQAAVVLTLSKATNITGNQTYWDDYIEPILNFTTYFLWSTDFGQFHSTIELNGTSPDFINRPSDLSFCLNIFWEIATELDDLYLCNLLDTSLINMINTAWDDENQGFFRKFFINGTLIDTSKWTIEQAIPLYLFCSHMPEFPINYRNFWLYLSIFLGSLVGLVYLYFKPEKAEIL